MKKYNCQKIKQMTKIEQPALDLDQEPDAANVPAPV